MKNSMIKICLLFYKNLWFAFYTFSFLYVCLFVGLKIKQSSFQDLQCLSFLHYSYCDCVFVNLLLKGCDDHNPLLSTLLLATHVWLAVKSYKLNFFLCLFK